MDGDCPETPEELSKVLRRLHDQREAAKAARKLKAPKRSRPSPAERRTILAKTAGRCHVCGGHVDGDWHADHVLAYDGGGVHAADNYLAAHALCNNYRWDYLAEEFQYILKIGVWARTHFEKQSAVGRLMAPRFLAYEKARRGRLKG